jgi:hypothetical protein
MEVHHHPDLKNKKKHFKEYFLEFLMIFLAVTLGFIAENVREGIGDRSKEKEYVESLVEDLKTDTAQIKEKMTDLYSQMNGIDTLEMFLSPEVNHNDSAVYKCYQQREYIVSQHPMTFSERTFTQLVSSGNMRLINKQSVSDSITQYYSTVKDVDDQKAYYIEYFHKCLNIFSSIYTFDSYHTTINSDGTTDFPKLVFGKLRILTTSPDDLDKIKSTLEFTKLIIGSYRNDIGNLNTEANSLISFLQKEYHLDGN